jgi:hypothetical protein
MKPPRDKPTSRARRLFPIVLLAALLAGCNDATSPDRARAQLDANRVKWVGLDRSAYSFTLQQNCFCVVVEPVRVSVRNDSVIAARTISANAPVDVRYVPTIAGLFAFIDRAITSKAAVLHVTYDPQLGYPTQIVYDGSLTAADDEVTYTVTSVSAATFSTSRDQ